MPFTFAHPAIIMPFYKRLSKQLDLSALVIGSMSPDFEYFLRFKPVSEVSHTILNSIFLNIPIGIAVYLLYHKLIKKCFFSHLPKPFDIWFEHFAKPKERAGTLRNYLVIVISLLIGAYSHILWDSFTHNTGYFVKLLPTLKSSVHVMNMSLPIYKVLQHGSTIAGFGIICIYLYLHRNRSKHSISRVSTKSKLFYWTVCGALTIIFTCLRMVFEYGSLQFDAYGIIIVTLISMFILSLIFASILYKLGQG